MLRVCGATMQAKPSEQMRCWCRGVFCGKGGARLSSRFFAAFHTHKTAKSAEQYRDLVGQADLFDGDATRLEWLGKVGPQPVGRSKRFA
jgi:hypothetical protein